MYIVYMTEGLHAKVRRHASQHNFISLGSNERTEQYFPDCPHGSNWCPVVWLQHLLNILQYIYFKLYKGTNWLQYTKDRSQFMCLLCSLEDLKKVFELYFWTAGHMLHVFMVHTCEQRKIYLRCSCKQAPFHCRAKKRVLIDLAAKIVLFHFI